MVFFVVGVKQGPRRENDLVRRSIGKRLREKDRRKKILTQSSAVKAAMKRHKKAKTFQTGEKKNLNSQGVDSLCGYFRTPDAADFTAQTHFFFFFHFVLSFGRLTAGQAEEEVLLVLQEPGDRAGQGPVRSRQPPGRGQFTPCCAFLLLFHRYSVHHDTFILHLSESVVDIRLSVSADHSVVQRFC